jgi:hypothetical protein
MGRFLGSMIHNIYFSFFFDTYVDVMVAVTTGMTILTKVVSDGGHHFGQDQCYVHRWFLPPCGFPPSRYILGKTVKGLKPCK